MAAIVFFLIVNTTYYWEGKIGFLAFVMFFISIVVYFLLLLVLIRQVYLGLKERPVKLLRMVTIGVLIAVLLSAYFKPHGLIDFSKFEAKDVLIAQSEGVANCMTTFKFKENFSFKERSVCFGVDEVKGSYRASRDTLYFSYEKSDRPKMKQYQFAVIKQSGHQGSNKQFSLVLYRDISDKRGLAFEVIKNELIATNYIDPTK